MKIFFCKLNLRKKKYAQEEKERQNINNNKDKIHVTCVKQLKIVKTIRRKILIS